MSAPARVAVVVPVHEQAAFLPRALLSLLEQDEPGWEAVVVNDGSRDPAAVDEAVAAATGGDPRVRVVRHLDGAGRPDNRGLGAALNTGLDATAAPVVAYLPADDVCFAGHLTALLAALDGDLAPDGDPAPDGDRAPDGEAAVLAWSGVRHHGVGEALDGPPGHGLQLVQVAHRRTADRWVERPELESDDLEKLLWGRLRERGPGARTGTVTCEWTDHPGQRHKAIRESFDGGLNVFRSRYRVAEPLRLHSTDSGTVDEVELYRPFRERAPVEPAAGSTSDGLSVLLVGELAFNPERVLALVERGHRLTGLWTRDGLGFSTVGPLPFGSVAELVPGGWTDPADWRRALRRLAPDMIHAQLNWRAVPLALEVMRAAPGVRFVWHFKEAPQRCIVRGEWPQLAELVTGADACLVATDEERAWFLQALPGRLDPARIGVLDGDLPPAAWFSADAAAGGLGAEPGPKHSSVDGEPHTVVLGRPSGLTEAFVVGPARRGVHVHLHGQVEGPGGRAAWRGWLDAARAVAPHRVHAHPAVAQPDWLRVLGRYDAGWLHRFTSTNGGDLRRATWDDLNTPARLPVLLGAGLPLLLQENPGQLVAVQRLAHGAGAALAYPAAGPHDEVLNEALDALAEVLHAEVATGAAAAAATRARWSFTHDAHADRLVDVLRGATLPR